MERFVVEYGAKRTLPRRNVMTRGLILLAGVALTATAAAAGSPWARNDPTRPSPPRVAPGKSSAAAPSDAIVLFDGQDLSAFDVAATPGWTVRNGVMSSTGKVKGYLKTRASFGDIQLHLEFREPTPPTGEGQHRGNSGVVLMNAYEIQIVDVRDNPTYADGWVGAVYGQTPPVVDASRGPGDWQAYDIVFHAPKVAGGHVVGAPTVTVMLNGVLVQDDVSIPGVTASKASPPAYGTIATTGPLALQDHGDGPPVTFRNIWVRPLKAP